MTSGLGIKERRTAIEVRLINQRMTAAGAYWQWTNTLQQLADGLTKLQARGMLAEAMRRGNHAIKYDPTYTAGKKLTKKQRDAAESELNKAAEISLQGIQADSADYQTHYDDYDQHASYEDKQDYEYQAFNAEDVQVCALEGCDEPAVVQDGIQLKYCSRRHFYSDLHGDRTKRAAAVKIIASLTAASQFRHGDANIVIYQHDNVTVPEHAYYSLNSVKHDSDPLLIITFTLVVGFLGISAYVLTRKCFRTTRSTSTTTTQTTPTSVKDVSVQSP
jgi:hypothetical protein